MNNRIAIVCANSLARLGLLHILSDSVDGAIMASSKISELDFSELATNALVLIDTDVRVEYLEALRACLDADVSVKPIILSDALDLEEALGAFRNGASAIINKDIACECLLASLDLVRSGQRVLPPKIIDELERALARPSDLPNASRSMEHANLSLRETDVLSGLAAGSSNKIIARKLDLSEATVKVHVKAILRKLQVKNRTQAAIWASGRQTSMRVISGTRDASL